jgi:arylsulfatase A-like enzyme
MKGKMTRREFMVSLATVTAGASIHPLWSKSAYPQNLPNVLIIQPDQHRGTIMGCAGDQQVITPNLDQLAAEGIRFTHCASSSPLCSPFRASMQTGLYIHKHGIDKNNILLDPKFKTIAEFFTEKGYATGYIGKWHLDGGIPDPQPGGFIEPGPRRQGYQEWYGYEKSHEYLKVWKYNENREQVRVEGYNWEPTWHTDMFLDFAKRNRDLKKPWMYYLAYGPPHDPEQCLKKYLDLYPPEKFELPPDTRNLFNGEDEQKLRILLQIYYGLVSAIDVEIGRVVKGLKGLGLDENTIILYTSDHGDKLGSHCTPERLRGKASPYATAFRIPLIIRWSGKIKENQICNALVSGVDLAPTILDIAGIAVPPEMQGNSMASWCFNQKGRSNEAIYMGLGGVSSKNGWRAVWDGRYVYSPIGFNILYDHKNDPYEMKNLIDSADYKKERKRLDALMLKLARKTEDPMLPLVEQVCVT